MEAQQVKKWEGKESVVLEKSTPDKVWNLLQDFGNIHKYFPGLDASYLLEGVNGEPGLIRYCESVTTEPSSDGSDETLTSVKWAKEKLLFIDQIKRCFSYEVVENNMGFKNYVATVKVSPIDGDGNGNGNGNGCEIEWSYVADEVEGWKVEDLNEYIGFCLRFMGNKMEEAVLSI